MGLLDGLLGTSMDDPRTMGLLALAGGMVRGDFGGGLLGAGQAYQGAQDAKMKRELVAQDLALKKLAEQRAQQQFKMQWDAYYGDGSGGAPASSQSAIPPSSGGPLGSGVYGMSIGGQSAAAPQNNIDAQLSRIGKMAIAGVPGAREQLDILKYRNDPQKVEAGGYTRNPITGELTYNPDPVKGITMGRDGSVQMMPNALNTISAQTLASEGPKAVLQALGQVNMRPMANGQQAPVPAINELPAMQSLASRFGLQTQGPAQIPHPRPQSQPQMPSDAMPPAQPGMVGKFSGDPTQIAQAISQIKDPQERANALSAFESQMRQTNGNLPTAYGQTTEQQNQAAANKEYAVKTAGDVVEQRKAIMNAGMAAPTNIAKLNQLGQLLAGVDGGKFTPMGTEVASALNSLGIKVDKNLGNKQAAAALGNEIALQLRSPAGGAGMPGALSDKDREFLQSMTPNMAQSLEGRTKLIQSRMALEQRNQQVAQFARKYEDKYGRLDNKFFDQLQAWSNANPLFGGK